MELDTDKIISTVADVYGVTVDDILGKSREQPIAEARQMCMYVLRQNGLKYYEIKNVLGRKHPSIIHDVQHIAAIREVYPDVKEKYNEIKGRL